MYNKILVPVDGSKHSRTAAKHALELADTVGASVCFLHVVSMNDASKVEVDRIEQGHLAEDLIERGETKIEDIVQEIDNYDVETTTHVLIGRPDVQILKWIQTNDPDLVVMGSRGLTGLSKFVLGSVADNVSRRTAVPTQLIEADQA